MLESHGQALLLRAPIPLEDLASILHCVILIQGEEGGKVEDLNGFPIQGENDGKAEDLNNNSSNLTGNFLGWNAEKIFTLGGLILFLLAILLAYFFQL